MNIERFKQKYRGLKKHTRIINAKAKQYKVRIDSISYLSEHRFIKVKYGYRRRQEVFYLDAFGFPIVTRGRCDFAISRLLKTEII